MSTQSLETNYVLIDFENVQPQNLELLHHDYFQVYLFLGAKQDRFSVRLAEAMHAFGPERAKYIRVSQTKPNALDFHITYYMGELAVRDPKAYFHVISKDKGFDPLIEHLTGRNINAHRRASIADIPVLTVHENANIDEKFKAVIINLIGRGTSKPRKEKTLLNTIKHTFKNELSDRDVLAIFTKLQKSKYVTSVDGAVTYALPA